MNTYKVGNVVRLKGVWTDPNAADAPIDPAVVIIKYTDPLGATTSVTYPSTIIKESVGIYHLDVSINVAGLWWYDTISTGVGAARAENSFLVEATHVP